MNENSYIPVIGNSMLYPIMDLFEKIEDVNGPNVLAIEKAMYFML